MTESAETAFNAVVKIAQSLLVSQQHGEATTPAAISATLDTVLRLSAEWHNSVDREAATDELIRRFSLWIGQDTTLRDDRGHVPWLVADRRRSWRYWQRYSEWLELRLSWKAVKALDDTTEAILSLLEDPCRPGPWDRRGLVVGHVQSGKTGNYTGLVCKGADAGYKIIVVLAGLHNNLRSQTQMRLDEGFLGYETAAPHSGGPKVVGVGLIDADPTIRPNFATNRSNNGDFNSQVARQFGVSPEQRPWLFVVKKNKTVLTRLHSWVEEHVANTRDASTGRKIVSHLPLLLIDDEADHASVDTGERVVDENGQPDTEHEPTAINSLIRRILFAFDRSAYVGYTATPFANIFIHERGATTEEGPDLFPSAFIVNLAAPSNYVGPGKLFGLRRGGLQEPGLPLFRKVTDHCGPTGGWMPQNHKNGHRPYYPNEEGLPPSLLEAVDAFLLSSTVRLLRKDPSPHASMLVHVSRFTSVQREVHRLLDEHLRMLQQRLSRRIDHEACIARLKSLWINDFEPTAAKVRETLPGEVPPDLPSWSDVESVISDVAKSVVVRTINGTAKDALDYADDPKGLRVIAVGGDKLARGLTLEGLAASYFLRASRMYDTLMQMGRWFGYRPGYLDVCRLYTTEELSEWFGHIADAAEELREEFDSMAASRATPREYGLKVRAHPALMVTSRLKMRTAKNLWLSFSGHVVETVTLHRDPRLIQVNYDAFSRLLERLGAPERDPKRERGSALHSWKGCLWNEVDAARVSTFLSSYSTHPAALKVVSKMVSEFIDSMVREGELTHWTVALLGGAGTEAEVPEYGSLRMVKRTRDSDQSDRYSIGRLLSGRDEAIDLDGPAWAAALDVTRQAWHPDPARDKGLTLPDEPNGPAIRQVRGFGAPGIQAHPERGLLLLYLLDPAAADADFPPDTMPIVAFGASFPGSRSGIRVEYRANNVLWETEYGPSE